MPAAKGTRARRVEPAGPGFELVLHRTIRFAQLQYERHLRAADLTGASDLRAEPRRRRLEPALDLEDTRRFQHDRVIDDQLQRPTPTYATPRPAPERPADTLRLLCARTKCPSPR